MLHIDEHTLTVLLAAQSVRHFELHEGPRGFGVFLGIDASDEDGLQAGMLITTRMKHQRDKRPRTWASVDSFVQFLKAKAAMPPEVRIHFNEGGKTSNRKPQVKSQPAAPA